MKIWVVGQSKGFTESGTISEFQGVFDTYGAARAACRKNYFIIPADMNVLLPDETMEQPGFEYPCGWDAEYEEQE